MANIHKILNIIYGTARKGTLCALLPKRLASIKQTQRAGPTQEDVCQPVTKKYN